jgi:uncharacterized membrane protein
VWRFSLRLQNATLFYFAGNLVKLNKIKRLRQDYDGWNEVCDYQVFVRILNMTERAKQLAIKFLKREWDSLNEREKKIVESLIHRGQIARNVNRTADDERTFGERIADKVAAFGGSWTFIIIFATVLIGWVILNSLILLNRGFDPYPYILLNLFLSMLAAIQAPIIMMSQNRQAVKDRQTSEHDYEINLKAELEICAIQEKLDELREQKWAELVEMQQQQIRLLEKLLREQIKSR